MNIFKTLAATAIAASAVGLTAALPAQAAVGQRSCFFSSDWRGWSAPSPDTLYLKVRNRDVYRVDLVGGTRQVMWPSNHLINRVTGSSQICGPLDLNLAVSDGHGFATPLFVRALTKLTPEEVAALPRKYRP